MDKTPHVSIVIPIHNMMNGAEFLWRNINSIMEQTFKDYEIIIVREGKMAENTNAGIKRARGRLIKILFLDDMFADKNSLQKIVDSFKGHWLITGATGNPYPYYTDNIHRGFNKLGTPSAMTILNEDPMLFDETMSWLLDCDYYKKMYQKYGEPVILDGEQVTLGTGPHQMTQILTQEEKIKEEYYMIDKWK